MSEVCDLYTEVLIVDDAPTDAHELKKLIEASEETLGCKFNTSICTSPQRALEYANGFKNVFRLVFVDVLMPEMQGTELIPALREKADEDTLFILMSSQSSYISEGYPIEAFDFICKPFEQEKVLKILKRALCKRQYSSKGSLKIYVDKVYYMVDYRDILIVQVSRNYTTITTSSRKYCYRCTMKELMMQLPKCFVQVSRNTVVNINKVTAISNDMAYLKRYGITVEVGGAYIGQLCKTFKEIY